MRELVPRFLLERVASGAEHGVVEASAIYLDVAGFTPMTEALAEHGHHGAETLAEILQAAWRPIVRAVHAVDGFCAAFAGDALTALFTGPRHGPRAVAAAQAIAVELTALREQTTPYGVFELTVRLGVASGPVQWTVLRAASAARASYVFSGPAIARAVLAERRARSGEVVVDAGVGDEDAQATWRSEPAEAPAPEAELERLAAGFLNPALLDWRGPGEFRPIVPVFVAMTLSDVAAVMADALELQDRFAGALRPVEVGDKGPVLLTLWGAPVGFEGDPERALRYAEELRRRHPSVRIGAGYGIAFTGFIGSPEREEYAVYGTEVNLAARLMSTAATGEILLSPALAARVGNRFALHATGARPFKGIAEPVEVHALGDSGAQREADSIHSWVNRDDELAALAEFFAPLRAGLPAGGVALLSGEAGIGKSSLAAEARRRLGDVRWIATGLDPVWREPLAPFRAVVAIALDLAAGAGATERRRHLDAAIARLELAAHRDFLGPLVDVHREGSTWATTEPAERQRRTLSAVSALLRYLSRDGLVLQIDDIQWSDLETLAFLPTLVRELADVPFALLLTSRDGMSGLDSGALDARVLQLSLQSLSTADVGRLAGDRVGAALAPATVQRLAQRTAGNPFFVEQLVLHLSERGLLSESTGGLADLAEAELPPSVEEVVIARLDDLPPGARQAVRVAAVLGLRADLGELARVLAADGVTVALEQAVQAAAAKGFWRSDGVSVEFSHALVRDAAYSTLLVVTRTRLHRAAAAAIQARGEAQLGPHLHRLAGHYAQAGELLQAAECERRAADRALGLGAYREAAEYAEHGLELASRGGEREATARLRLGLWLALGTARIVVFGQTAEATRDAYHHAYALSGALEMTREGFRALFGLRTYALFAGEHEASLAMAERSLEVAEELGEGDLLVQAHLMVGNARFWVGELESAVQHLDEVERRMAAEDHAGHLSGFAQDPRFTAVFPAAMAHSLLGESARARAMALEGLAAARAVGHRFSEAMLLQTVGFLHAREGRAADALATGRELVELARAEEFPVYVAIGSVIVGWAQARLGETEAGLALIRATVESMRERGMNVAKSLIGALVADAWLAAGDGAAALAAASEALEDARERRELAFERDLVRLCRAAFALVDAGVGVRSGSRSTEGGGNG